MNETYIQRALEKHLQTSSITQIAWEYVHFTKPDSGIWVRCTMLPAETTRAALSKQGYSLYQGIFAVDVFGPLGVGTGSQMIAVQEIVDLFKDTVTLQETTVCVRIDGASILPAINDTKFYQIPIRIKYHAHLVA